MIVKSHSTVSLKPTLLSQGGTRSNWKPATQVSRVPLVRDQLFSRQSVLKSSPNLSVCPIYEIYFDLNLAILDCLGDKEDSDRYFQ
jgi:hypothetical protein